MPDTQRSAGWYPDPAGRHQHRYWDGAGWTTEVADAGVAFEEEEGSPETPRTAVVRDRGSRRRIGVGLAVVGVALLAPGLTGFLVVGAADDSHTEEREILDASGVDAAEATDDLEAATDAADTALVAFHNALGEAVDAHNGVVTATGCDPLSPFGCEMPSAEVIEAEVVPAAATYSTAVDNELNALSTLTEAVAALDEELG